MPEDSAILEAHLKPWALYIGMPEDSAILEAHLKEGRDPKSVAYSWEQVYAEMGVDPHPYE